MLTILRVLFLAIQIIAQTSQCTDEGDLHDYRLEYRSADGKKSVLLVGMTHMAPRAYFDQTQKQIATFAKKYPGRVTVLNEFWTCQKPVIGLADDSRLTVSQFKQLNLGNRSPAGLGRAPLDQILGPNALGVDSCVRDGNVGRPKYVADAYRRNCEGAHAKGFACQWTDFHLPTSPNIEVREGDLNFDSLTPGAQWNAAAIFKDHYADNLGSAEQKIYFAQEKDFIYRRRNQNVMDALDKALSTSAHAVLPWGSEHLNELAPMLEAKGYQLVDKTTAKIAGASDLGRWPMFDHMYKSTVAKTPPCRPANNYDAYPTESGFINQVPAAK